ncbi:MAG TPA: TonB-dependent receptor [Prolixibacteraceae bacterium]|nr:TonB-dependent receptor [Prolixibacteraceae bacterium]
MNKGNFKNIARTIQAAFLLIGFMVLTNGAWSQQTFNAKGTVVDQQNNPLPGATVVVEGTTKGVITDIDGNFEINCSKGNTLLISFIGYKNQQIIVQSEQLGSIVLTEDFVTLNEAVVVGVGYGTMRKSDLTGAIASVDSDELKQGVVSSTEQLLQGRVAGLTVIQGTGDPASGASLRLRGGTSLSASNGPLVVVDGIPGVDFNAIHPSEIVSIDVLKDASAAAIYGSRGANGVIIVTTNRANKGKSMQYQGYVAVGTVSNHIDMLSANQWRAWVRENEVTSAIDYGGNTDWQKELEQTSISQSHVLTFNSSTETSGYRVSVNYLNNQGIIKNTQLERLGASLSAFQYGFDNKLKVEAGINTNFDKWNPYDGRIFERMLNLSPTIPVYNPDGSFTRIGGTKYDNPVELHTNRFADNTRHRLLAYTKAELEIIEGLKAVANASYEYNSQQSRLYKPSYAVMEGISDKGFGQRTLGDYTTMQLETYLTYNKQLTDNHRINLLGGYSYLDNTYEGFGAMRRGFDSDLFLYNNLGAGQDYRAGDVYSYKGQAKLISFFARANYNYMGRYMFTATVRRDGSSRFGANNKWGVFPSASVAWRISDESFMAGTSAWLDNLKLRAGYGVTGNQDGIGEYKSLSLLGAGSDTYYDAVTQSWKQSYGPIQNPNPNLRWETTAQANIGLDFSLIGRINGTVELYNKNTYDLLYTYRVSSADYAFPTIMANVGSLNNKGIELTLNGNLMNTNNFNWDANITLAKNMQKVTQLSDEQFQTDDVPSGSLHGIDGMSGQFSQIIAEGYPVGTFWGPLCTGIDSLGKFMMADDGALQDIGNVQPKLSYGFGTSLSYKNFDLDVSMYGMYGQKVLNATAMILHNPARLPSLNVTDSFLESGITDKVTYSSYWVEDASFLRLQTLTLAYNIDGKKFGLGKVRLYVTGENLFVLTNYTGTDPEVSIEGLDNPGFDWFNVYPKPRTFSFGANISF